MACTADLDKADWATVNPATGPVAVAGARPGDTLTIEIIDIRVAEKGVMVAIPGWGAFGSRIKEPLTKVIPVVGEEAVFNEKIRLPLKPMIGIIGVAPEEGAVPCGTPGPHGGNMDTRLITNGSRLFLPVFVEGALLSVGDLHAVMGDGEVIVCGLEISGEVELKVKLVKGRNFPTPVLETQDAWYTVASASNLDEAAQRALDCLADFLTERMSLPFNEIGMLLSAVGNLEVSQIVDPLKTARMGIGKRFLAGYDVKF